MTKDLIGKTASWELKPGFVVEVTIINVVIQCAIDMAVIEPKAGFGRSTVLLSDLKEFREAPTAKREPRKSLYEVNEGGKIGHYCQECLDRVFGDGDCPDYWSVVKGQDCDECIAIIAGRHPDKSLT